MESAIDYASSGMNIRQAMLDIVRRYPDKSQRPDHILWNGQTVLTYDWIDVPRTGTVRFEFLSARADIDQGFDARLDDWFQLEQGLRVTLLRTWKDDRYEDVVKYTYVSRDGRMAIWNVYKEILQNGMIMQDKWGGNAGFLRERISDTEHIYHCSPAMFSPPDFDALVFKLTITPDEPWPSCQAHPHISDK